jgi:hypothetical protein
MSKQSVANALITRTFDFEKQFQFAYSKIVGLQAVGPWTLKKDFITLEKNVQTYEIPAGREINELLWFANNTSSLFGPFGMMGGGFDGAGLGANQTGYAQFGSQGSFFMMSGFDYLVRAQEANILNRILGGSLTYRVTASLDGKKLIHLMNTPGGRFNWSTYSSYVGSKVWYWYYEVDGADRDSCLRLNPDIIRLPSDVPLDALSWQDLNEPAQQWVRRWFTAYVKETLGRVRGKYSGNLKTPDSEIQLEYQSLQTEGKDEKLKLLEELQLRLERLRPEKQMEKEALIAENLNKQLKFRAFQRQIYVI